MNELIDWLIDWEYKNTETQEMLQQANITSSTSYNAEQLNCNDTRPLQNIADHLLRINKPFSITKWIA